MKTVILLTLILFLSYFNALIGQNISILIGLEKVSIVSIFISGILAIFAGILLAKIEFLKTKE